MMSQLQQRFNHIRHQLIPVLNELQFNPSYRAQSEAELCTKILITQQDPDSLLADVIDALREKCRAVIHDETQQEQHAIAFQCCQYLTYLMPKNQYHNATQHYYSELQTQLLFPDNRYYCSMGGKLIHISELQHFKPALYKAIDTELHSYEKNAIIHFIQQEREQDKNIVINFLRHHTVRGFIVCYLYLDSVLNRYQECRSPSTDFELGDYNLWLSLWSNVMSLWTGAFYYFGYALCEIATLGQLSAGDSCGCLLQTITDVFGHIADIPTPLMMIAIYSALVMAIQKAYPAIKTQALSIYSRVSGDQWVNADKITQSIEINPANSDDQILLKQIDFTLESRMLSGLTH